MSKSKAPDLMTEKKKPSLKELRTSIWMTKKTLQWTGGFGHNIIALDLQMIAAHYGVAEANKAIRDLKLDQCGWKEEPCEKS